MADEIHEEVFDGIECLYFPYGINEEMLSCKVATLEELDELTCHIYIEDEDGNYDCKLVYSETLMVCNADAYMPE